jgi:hypothetical protein
MKTLCNWRRLHGYERNRHVWSSGRARILLAYRSDPSAYAAGEAIGVTHQTVQRCLDRARRLGAMAAFDDSPRPGRAPQVTNAAKAWLVSLACQKAKDPGVPARTLDHAIAGAAYPHGRCGSWTSLPEQHRPRHGLQNSRTFRGQATQGPLLSRTARRTVRDEDGRRALRLSRGCCPAGAPRCRDQCRDHFL